MDGEIFLEVPDVRNIRRSSLSEMAAAASASMEKLTISLPAPESTEDVLEGRKRAHSPSPGLRTSIYKYGDRRPSADAITSRQRHPSGDHSTKQKHGLFNGLKELTQRVRTSSTSGSTDADSNESKNDARKSLLKMRARKAAQQLSLQDSLHPNMRSVYDLREDDDDEENAGIRPRSYSTDLIIVRKTSRPLTIDILGSVDNLDNPYVQYLKLLTCYDLSPYKGTVVLLDKELTIHRAFLALATGPESVGLIWDATKGQVKGLLTPTDFLTMLYHSNTVEQDSVHKNTLDWWLKERDNGCSEHGRNCPVIKKKLYVSVGCEFNVFDAAKMIVENHIHRLPVHECESSEPFYLLGLRRILLTVQRQLRSMPLTPWMLLSSQVAEVGTWKDLKTVHLASPISEAIGFLLTDSMSSLVVVDEYGRFLDNLTKSDILNLLAVLPTETTTEAYKMLLGNEVKDALNARPLGCRARGAFCSTRDTLVTVVDLLVGRSLRCIYALDDESKIVKAAISVSDVMRYVIKHSTTPS